MDLRYFSPFFFMWLNKKYLLLFDGTCLGKPPVRFCDVGCCSLLFLGYWLLFFIHCFSTSSLILPRAIVGFWHSFYTFILAYRRVVRNAFILTFSSLSFIVLPRALQFWGAIFYTEAFFTIRSFLTFLSAFTKTSLGTDSSSLKVAGLYADPQNTYPVHVFVWLTAIHNLDNQEISYLNCTNYYLELLVVESLVYFRLTLLVTNFLLVQSHM